MPWDLVVYLTICDSFCAPRWWFAGKNSLASGLVTQVLWLRQFLPLMPFTPDHCQAGLAGEWKSQSKSQITGPVVGLSDDLFSVEKVTLKTSHHNFHPWVISIDPRHHHMTCISKNVALRTRNLLGEDPRQSQKYILKKKVRPNHQVGKKNRCHYITNPKQWIIREIIQKSPKKTASCLILNDPWKMRGDDTAQMKKVKFFRTSKASTGPSKLENAKIECTGYTKKIHGQWTACVCI